MPFSVYVFKPSRQDPIYHHSNASNSSSVTSAIFIPHNNDDTNQAALDWQKKETLYYMTKDMKLLTLGVHTEEEDSPYNRSGVSRNPRNMYNSSHHMVSAALSNMKRKRNDAFIYF